MITMTTLKAFACIVAMTCPMIGLGTPSSLNSMDIERSQVLFSGALDESELHQIATLLGPGSYWVRAAFVPENGTIVGSPAVFFFYRSIDDLTRLQPAKRLLWCKNEAKSIEQGGDVELLNAYLSSRAISLSDLEALHERIRLALAAILYENRAVLLRADWKNLSDERLDLARYTGGTMRRELQALVVGTRCIHDDDHRCVVWGGRFVHDNGSVEDVTVTITDAEKTAKLTRRLLEPIGYFPAVHRSASGAEEWSVNVKGN